MIGDQEPKYAMDGMIAGIVKNFDMECHTEEADWYGTTLFGKKRIFYTKQLEFDYPAFNQIWRLRIDTKTDIIFLTKKSKVKLFEAISDFLQNGIKAVAAFDTEDDTSKGLDDIIKEQYER